MNGTSTKSHTEHNTTIILHSQIYPRAHHQQRVGWHREGYNKTALRKVDLRSIANAQHLQPKYHLKEIRELRASITYTTAVFTPA
jgi:hypothetical protein